MARDQGDKPEASSSFVASDDNMLVDPPQEHQDVSCAAAQSFSSRCLFDWFADSGATQHMSDQRQLMINYKPIEPGTWSVSGIGGMTLPVLGVGDVPVITQIDGDLFSIGAATAKGMKGFFSGNKCFFYSDKQLILTGERPPRRCIISIFGLRQHKTLQNPLGKLLQSFFGIDVWDMLTPVTSRGCAPISLSTVSN